VPSGKGLLPGDAGYSGSFKDSMQRIITNLKQAKKIPLLAKVPFVVNASASRDKLIRDYIVVIDELVAANNIRVTPPIFMPISNKTRASYLIPSIPTAKAIKR